MELVVSMAYFCLIQNIISAIYKFEILFSTLLILRYKIRQPGSLTTSKTARLTTSQ